MKQSFLPIKIFLNEPYSKILCYPNPSKRQITSRMNELKKLKISKIAFEGSTRIGNLQILGKGYVGVVVLAKQKTKTVALKIRRLDSQRNHMNDEAKLLKLANKAGVGPKFISNSRNFIVMEYLDGEKIGKWVSDIKGKGSVKKIKSAIKKTLEDCYNLDKIGLDHGELSSVRKHVIIGKNTTLIDFESSSVKRRVSNVTSATQGILIGSGISKKISRIYKCPSKNEIISVLRNYKKDKNRTNFDELLRILKLQNV